MGGGGAGGALPRQVPPPHHRRRRRRRWGRRGRAVQVDPIKPTLKAPGTKRLRLKYDVPLSNLLSNLTCAATARSSTPLWKRSSLRRPPCNTARLVGPCNCEIRSCEYLHIVLHASDPCFLRYISSDDVAIITHLALIHLALRPGDSAAAAAAAAAVAAAAAGGGGGCVGAIRPGRGPRGAPRRLHGALTPPPPRRRRRRRSHGVAAVLPGCHGDLPR